MPRRLVPGLVLCLILLPVGLGAKAPEVKKPYFDSNGVKIHYNVQGKEDGEPVLLIHGFSLNSKDQWEPVLKALAKDYKLITMDCRGHGGSEKSHDPKKYGPEMVKDVVRLLDHLKIEKAHLVGYSMGGGFALNLAARQPERVKSVTMGGAGLPAPDRDKLMEAAAESLEQGKGMRPLIVALAPKDKPKLSELEIQGIDAFFLSGNDPKTLAAVLRGFIKDKESALSEEEIKRIKAPMLALIGADDPTKAGVDRLKKLVPELKVVVIDNASHGTTFSREEFVRALKEFLDAHRAAKK